MATQFPPVLRGPESIAPLQPALATDPGTRVAAGITLQIQQQLKARNLLIRTRQRALAIGFILVDEANELTRAWTWGNSRQWWIRCLSVLGLNKLVPISCKASLGLRGMLLVPCPVSLDPPQLNRMGLSTPSTRLDGPRGTCWRSSC